VSDPIRRSILVRATPERAFAVFTEQIDAWWPPSHRKGGASTTFVLEPREGGRFFQRTAEGDELALGEVVRFEPPEHLVYTWHPGSDVGPTTVEIRFTAEPEGTRVDVVHSEGDSGLAERWTDRAAIFERSWPVVLDAFAAHLS